MTFPVPPKKSLGQHFLKDENIARKIVAALPDEANRIIEVGPGMGVLTKYLLQRHGESYFIDTDHDSIAYLVEKFPEYQDRFIRADFLRYDLGTLYQDEFSVIGNFPYNISSQIFFKILDHRD